MKTWLVRPWYDEGDDWPEECGTATRVEAEDEEGAREAYFKAKGVPRGLSWLEIEEAGA